MEEFEDQDRTEDSSAKDDLRTGGGAPDLEETAALEKLLSEKVCDPAVAAGSNDGI